MLSASDIQIIKNLLKPFATKDDISGLKADISDIRRTFATKDDLKNLVTKDDAKGFATKNDLKNLVTKDDAKLFATKDDLTKEIKPLKKDISKIKKDVSTLINFFDRENLSLGKRIGNIENYLKLSATI